MVADWRAEERNEWITIGWILYNIGDGTAEALEHWIEFSQRCEEKFEEANCIYEWERMTPKDLSLGTLHYYASIDNPELYKKYKQKQSEKHVQESLNGSHNDIAKILFTEYGNEFVCGSITGKSWYQFKDHRWQEIEEGTYLRSRISDKIILHYSEMASSVAHKLATSQDKAESSMYDCKYKQIQKMINNLKSALSKIIL